MTQETSKKDSSLSRLTEKSPPTKKDEEIATLQQQLAREKERRLEDWFLFILILLILIDSFIFAHMETWGGPIAIVVLEAILLLVLGRRFGVDDVKALTERVLDRWPGSNNSEK